MHCGIITKNCLSHLSLSQLYENSRFSHIQRENPLQLGFVGLFKTRLKGGYHKCTRASVFYDLKDIVKGLIPNGGLKLRVIEEKTLSQSKAAIVKEYWGC